MSDENFKNCKRLDGKILINSSFDQLCKVRLTDSNNVNMAKVSSNVHSKEEVATIRREIEGRPAYARQQYILNLCLNLVRQGSVPKMKQVMDEFEQYYDINVPFCDLDGTRVCIYDKI